MTAAVGQESRSDREGARLRQFYGEMTSLDGILGAMSMHGLDPDHVTAADLYTRGLDCQNLGGFPHLELIAEAVGRVGAPTSGDRVLDVGCGIGGPSRFVADRFGCNVLGVDLLPIRTETARALTVMTGMDDRIEYRAADATALPLEDGSFTQAWMLDMSIHVRDKPRLFSEVARVVRDGGLLVLHDQTGPLPPTMRPVKRVAPFLAPSLSQLIRIVEDAGFKLLVWQDTTPQVIEFFAKLRELMTAAAQADAAGAPARPEQSLAIIDGYLATLASPRGRTGLLLARRAAGDSASAK